MARSSCGSVPTLVVERDQLSPMQRSIGKPLEIVAVERDLRFEQIATEHTERIRFYREEGGWRWHIEYHWRQGLRPCSDTGNARWKWLARYRAERGLERLCAKARTECRRLSSCTSCAQDITLLR